MISRGLEDFGRFSCPLRKGTAASVSVFLLEGVQRIKFIRLGIQNSESNLRMQSFERFQAFDFILLDTNTVAFFIRSETVREC